MKSNITMQNLKLKFNLCVKKQKKDKLYYSLKWTKWHSLGANAAKLLFCSESWSGDFDKNQYYFIAQRSDYCFAQPLDQQSIIFLNTFIFHVPSRYAIDHIKNVLCSCALPVTHCLWDSNYLYLFLQNRKQQSRNYLDFT